MTTTITGHYIFRKDLLEDEFHKASGIQSARRSAFNEYLENTELAHTGIMETSEAWTQRTSDLMEYTFFIKYEE